MSMIERPIEAAAPASGAIAAWLLDGARSLDGCGALLHGLAARLVAAGLPLWRCTLHLPQLHPQLWAVTHEWLADTGEVTERRILRQVMQSQAYHHSPIALLQRSGARVRRRLAGPDADVDFPVLEELRERGATDYALVPMPLGNGRLAAIGLATRAEGGFAPGHLELVEALAPALGTVAELHVAQATMRGLLETYVGREAGRRILSGQVTLGAARSIQAALYFCDLRGFTALSERLGRDDLLGLLNDYFAAMAGAVLHTGGDILKYMGDGLLAIFPVGAEETADVACARALSAAREGVAALAEANEARIGRGQPQIRTGIALHVGTVLYGNIGAEDRLDFTVIGPAVNRAARIEVLCRELDRAILASRRFAQACPLPMQSLGRHALRGVEKPQEVFTVAG